MRTAPGGGPEEDGPDAHERAPPLPGPGERGPAADGRTVGGLRGGPGALAPTPRGSWPAPSRTPSTRRTRRYVPTYLVQPSTSTCSARKVVWWTRGRRRTSTCCPATTPYWSG